MRQLERRRKRERARRGGGGGGLQRIEKFASGDTGGSVLRA